MATSPYCATNRTIVVQESRFRTKVWLTRTTYPGTLGGPIYPSAPTFSSRHMIARVAVAMLLGLLVTVGIYFWAEYDYDRFRFVSEETMALSVLNEEQNTEIDASIFKNDQIGFTIYGAAITAICGLWCSPTASLGGRIMGFIGGAVLGAAAGAGANFVGHYFDRSIPFPSDPMLYWVGRWFAILTPIALACALVAFLSGKRSGKILGEGIAGAVLGMAAAVIVYCLTSGALTDIENHDFVFPGFPANRMLVFGLASVLIAGALTWRLGSVPIEPLAPASESDN